jgi:tetratricopeptide (TPR) repeat protein
MEANAQMSKQMANSLLTVDSPLVVGAHDGRVPAVTAHDSTPDPKDSAFFLSLTDRGELDEAMRLCLERLRTTHGEPEQLRWWRDAAIVERMLGRAGESLTILNDTYSRAEKLLGVPFGKHLHGIARSLQMLGHYDAALIRYGDATDFLKAEPILCAKAHTNIGRCYTAQNRPENSHEYFNRALHVAESHSDLLLQGEIHESIALAFEAQGNYLAGFEAAAKSVSLLAGTGHEGALSESWETRARLREKALGR